MGAVVGATTHGPLTAILMLFEMTGDYKIILPLMITCIISSLAAGQLLEGSIYTLKLIRRGIDIREGKEVNILKGIRVGEVMNPDVETIYEGTDLTFLADKITKSKYNSFPVVDAENQITGILSFFDYQEALFNEDLKYLVVAKDLATTDVVTVSTDDNLYEALQKVTTKDFSILPVVSPNNAAKLMGVLSRRDIIGAYDKAVLKKALPI
jgi:CIC family chloride channel protein